jgi:hypothetical protein
MCKFHLLFASFVLLLLQPLGSLAQADYYFPPTGEMQWESVSAVELGWCADEIEPLIEFLDSRNTKAFILLYKGRVVVEHYFADFTQNSQWLWNSAGKTLTAFTVGMAQQNGLLDIDDPVSMYLGSGWSSLPLEQEDQITIRHQLTMTTGLDDAFNNACTDPECLIYLADPGTRWAYHNAPYTLLSEVVAAASGQTWNGYVSSQVGSPIGMSGLYLPFDYNRVYASTARGMARFGLLMLAGGAWNGNPVMTDQTYFNALTTPSQDINESYGYLWWLNGQPSYMIPQVQLQLPGSFMPLAPADCAAAIGKDAQLLNVVTSKDLVLVRMGEDPSTDLVPFTLNNDIWEYLNALMCEDVSVTTVAAPSKNKVALAPNPAASSVDILSAKGRTCSVYALDGRLLIAPFEVTSDRVTFDLNRLNGGMVLVHITDGASTEVLRLALQ